MTSVYSRLKEMLNAKAVEETDHVTRLFFDKIIELVEDPQDIDWQISEESIQAKDFIDECYIYITAKRLSLEYDYLFDSSMEAKQEMHLRDDFYLKGIIGYRTFIFNTYDN